MKRATVGGYLVRRLEQAGLKHVFGVPGDYVLGFFDLLVESNTNGTITWSRPCCAPAGAARCAPKATWRPPWRRRGRTRPAYPS